MLAGLAAAVTAALAFPGAGPAAAVAPVNVADDLPNLSTPTLVRGEPRGFSTPVGPVVAVVARGADSSLLFSRRSATGDTFGPLVSLGCATAACGIAGDVSALLTTGGNIEIFLRGTNDLVYTNTVTPSNQVVGFGILPGLLASSEPKVVQLPGEAPGNIRVFVRGQDGAVWSNIRRDGVWAGWKSLGGFITSEISVAPISTFLATDRSFRLVARGGGGQVFVARVLDESITWQMQGDFRITSNIQTGPPNFSAGSRLYARGEDGRVWVRTLSVVNPQWTPIGDLSVTSDIGIAGSISGAPVIYVRGTDGNVYTNTTEQGFVGSPWVGYTRLDGVVTSNPVAYSPANNEQSSNNPIPDQTLLVRDVNGQLARNAKPSALRPYTGYTSIGGSILG